MRLDRLIDIDRISLLGFIFFVFYFVAFLIYDVMVGLGFFQYDYLALSIYNASIAYIFLSAFLLFLVFIYAKRKGLVKQSIMITSLGLVFLASPIRALFMIDLGGIDIGFYLSYNTIYDVVVIFLSAFLIFKFGGKVDKGPKAVGFLMLFYIYIFLIALSVPFRDFLVSQGMFLPISFGTYLHYGFYDYLTAYYAIVLGLLGAFILIKEGGKEEKIDDVLINLNDLMAERRYKDVIATCEKLIGKVEGEDERTLRVMWSYALLKLNRASDAEKVISNVEGEYGLKGDIMLALGRVEEAKRFYEKAVSENNDDYVSLLNLGKIYADTGNLAMAEDFFVKAWEKNKKSPETWHNVIAIQIVKGRHEDALKLLKEAEKHVKASTS